ncbi:uncharacterized protein LOC128996607 [Macrosteles quadrilineatus]|uniref:uncharacterized protein LOC128996607 n=1 Tax=Macrosteles quadrilineatus TaxID=74068 RepID=UPI0023E2AF5F|nr:uncharacterized protein LOC128996607 [Macrosteles quadrilineatus]
MILLTSFFLGILVGVLVERRYLGITSWGTEEELFSCSSFSSFSIDRRSRRRERDSSSWRIRATSAPSRSSTIFSTISPSMTAESAPETVDGILRTPRRLRRRDRHMEFDSSRSRVTWVDGSTSTISGPVLRQYGSLRRMRPHTPLPRKYSTSSVPATTSQSASTTPARSQPSNLAVQTPIQITNVAPSNPHPVIAPPGRFGFKWWTGKRRRPTTRAHLMFH